MSGVRMPDLRREGYFSSALVHLTDEERQRLWRADSYLEARKTLSRQTIIPSLSLLECMEELVSLGFQVERVDVVPLGVQEAWEGELIGQFPPPGTVLGPDDRVHLFVSHPSLADRLPEGFVATSKREGERDPQSVEDWSHEVFRERLEVARREEAPAMRLLRVAEAAMWHPRLELRLRLGLFEGIGDDLPLAERLLEFLRRRPRGMAVDRLRWLGNSLWVLGSSDSRSPVPIRGADD